MHLHFQSNRAEIEEIEQKVAERRFLLYCGLGLRFMQAYLNCAFCELVSSSAAQSP